MIVDMIYNLLEEGGAEETTKNTGSPVTTYIIMGVIILAIIGLFIWQSISSKKKQKEAQEKVDSLKKGDRVKTIGGICGFVAEIDNEENTFVLETGTGTKKSFIKFDKGAIYQTGPANPGKPNEKEEAKTEGVSEEKVEEKPEEDVFQSVTEGETKEK